MKFTAEVELTPKILADAFWNMTSEEQAEFFEELERKSLETRVTHRFSGSI